MKNWDNYFDEKGVLVHIGTEKNPNPEGIKDANDGTPTGGGDSLNREGHFWFTWWCFKKLRLPDAYALIFQSFGIGPANVFKINWDSIEKFACRYWKAHPDSTDEHYGTSRDQGFPALIMGLVNDCARSIQMLKYLENRNGMFPNLQPYKGDWNGDIMMPEHWSSAYRALDLDQHWAKIWFGDLWRFMPLFVRIYKSYEKDANGFRDNVGDSLNLNLEILLGVLRRPNIITRTQAWLWGKLVYGGPQYQLDAYFRQPHAPPINELYQPIHKIIYPTPLVPHVGPFAP